jgi:hypothetical protein
MYLELSFSLSGKTQTTEKELLKNIFGVMRDEVTVNLRKLYDKKLKVFK